MYFSGHCYDIISLPSEETLQVLSWHKLPVFFFFMLLWNIVPVFLFQVDKLVMIDASVYAEGIRNLTKLPRAVAYAGVSIRSPISIKIHVLAAFSSNTKPRGYCCRCIYWRAFHCGSMRTFWLLRVYHFLEAQTRRMWVPSLKCDIHILLGFCNRRLYLMPFFPCIPI